MRKGAITTSFGIGGLITLIFGWLFVQINHISDRADAANQMALIANTKALIVEQLAKDTKDNLDKLGLQVEAIKAQNDNLNNKLNILLSRPK